MARKNREPEDFPARRISYAVPHCLGLVQTFPNPYLPAGKFDRHGLVAVPSPPGLLQVCLAKFQLHGALLNSGGEVRRAELPYSVSPFDIATKSIDRPAGSG